MTTLPSILAGAAALSLAAAAAMAQEVTLRMHQFLPGGANVPAKILEPWADRIEAASGGRIEIQRFHSMQLGGSPPSLIDQVVDGTADIVWTLPGYTPGRFPRTEVMELPFLMSGGDVVAASRAYWTLGEEEMIETEFSDVHVLGLWVHGAGVLHAARPVETLSDMDGLKMRAPTRTVNMLLGALGATPVGMPAPAIPEALSQGVIDGAALPWEVTAALRVPELVAHHTAFEGDALYTATFLLAMNREAYDALPADLQQVIDDNSGLAFSAAAAAQMMIDDAESARLAEDLGNEIVTLSGAEAAAWREAAEPIIDAWTAEMDAAGLDGTALLARARALIAENR